MVKLDEDVASKLNNEVIKPKEHPGIIRPRIVSLPNEFIEAATVLLENQGKTLAWNYRFKNLVLFLTALLCVIRSQIYYLTVKMRKD